MSRVVSLVPSLTESLLEWGITPVGCTRFCEQPALTHVGGTKDPDIDAIESLHADVVLLCEEENRREDYEQLLDRGIRCLTVRIDSLSDVQPALAMLGDALGVAVDGTATSVGPARAARGLRVFVPIWRRPWMTLSAGTYGASLLNHLGYDIVTAPGDDRYPTVNWDEIVALDPDLVLLPTEPYPFKPRHLAEWAAVAPAAIVDGQDLFWWGTRTPAAIQRLETALDRLVP